MRIESNRDVGQLWLVSSAVFAICVGVVRGLGRDESVRTAALWIGYAGLAAIGLALLLTWQWLNHRGPRSLFIRVPLRLTVVSAIVLWMVALLVPFL
jgi:hypothetical protein